MNIRELLEIAVERRASDLHLRVSSPPIVRIDGALHTLQNHKPLSPADLEAVYEEVVETEKRKAFTIKHELDFSCSFPGLTRCRINVLQQRGTLSVAVRLIPFTVPTIEELHLPRVCGELALRPLGLILITGPTGSGKSSTIAAMIDYLNASQSRNIITIEDPIEYVHTNKKSIIAQRDVGHDTESFDVALVHALRHDPDVIVVGEIRELPTMLTALRAAETGHLVMGTLHTSDATQTINRVIDMFPTGQHDQVRSHLAQTLAAVLCQTLVPKTNRTGRVPAFEVMLANNPIRNLIREGRNHQIYGVLQVSKKEGMQTLNQSLAELVTSRAISESEACDHSTNVDELRTLCSYLKH